MNILHYIVAAILCLGPLIAIHEFGHFWVARRCGVKVLVYSIGFGRPLLKWRGKDGTQYQLAAIPLGGFVKMVDEREGNVAPQDLSYAFTQKSPWQRILIVAAGPVINLVFAVLLLWFIFVVGGPTEQLNTRIGSITPASVAQQAGLQVADKIVAVDQLPVKTWSDLNIAFVDRMGDSGTVALTVERQGQLTTVDLPIHKFMSVKGSSPFQILGFDSYVPNFAPVVGELLGDGPAIKQGLKVGDRIVQIGQTPIKEWTEVTNIVRASANQPLQVTVLRHNQPVQLTLTPAAKKQPAADSVEEQGQQQPVGQLGVMVKAEKFSVPDSYKETIVYTPWSAFTGAVKQTWDLSALTVESIGKLLLGKISLNNLSGPVSIANIAGETAKLGWKPFLSFMAFMSISLGVLNLMPIPVLDGGHLVYYTIEALRGKPVAEKSQQIGQNFGLVILVTMMVVALFNDLHPWVVLLRSTFLNF